MQDAFEYKLVELPEPPTRRDADRRQHALELLLNEYGRNGWCFDGTTTLAVAPPHDLLSGTEATYVVFRRQVQAAA